MTLPLCGHTDLPRLLCGCGKSCCDSFTMTVEEQAYLSGLQPVERDPDIPETRVVPLSYLAGPWRYGTVKGHARVPERLICDHGKPDGMQLCPDCQDRLELAVGDIPALVDDLTAALIKDTGFAERGAPKEADPDEASLPFNLAASDALRTLWRVFDGHPVRQSRRLLADWQTTLRRPDLEAFASRVTEAVTRAHHIIERPKTVMYYGECPKCGSGIEQERIDPEDPDGRLTCGCGYAAALDDHQRAQLDIGNDRWFTQTELHQVLEQGGEPATRWEVTNLIQRQGLVREKGARTRWRGGRVEHYEVDVFRLGEVRDLLLVARATRKLRRGA